MIMYYKDTEVLDMIASAMVEVAGGIGGHDKRVPTTKYRNVLPEFNRVVREMGTAESVERVERAKEAGLGDVVYVDLINKVILTDGMILKRDHSSYKEFMTSEIKRIIRRVFN